MSRLSSRFPFSTLAFSVSALGFSVLAIPAQANVPCAMAEPGMVQIGMAPSGSGGGQIAICGYAYGTGPDSGGQTAEDIAKSYSPGRDIEGERLQSDVNAAAQQLRDQLSGMGVQQGGVAIPPSPAMRAPSAAPAAIPSAGQWEFYEDMRSNAPAGQNCAVTYMDPPHGMVSLYGPMDGRKDALMTFMNDRIPKPSRQTNVQVRLLQTGDKAPATVTATHYTDPSSGMGTIGFYIPSPAAAADGMLDVVRFQIWLGEAQVVDIAWTNGKSAQQYFRRCLGS